MKQAFRQYGSVVVLLACILALSVGVTVLTGNLALGSHRAETKTVLATTYPIYVAAQRILGDDDTITLTRLDGAASGCLHDYQLSPSDRKAVQEADLILLNGAGAETFLDGIVDESKCVNTSAGQELLCVGHDHDHGGEHHEEEYNEHVWLSPSHYQQQLVAIYMSLGTMNADGWSTYARNMNNYYEEIEAISDEVRKLKATLAGRPCVLFHDSMAYLAADLGLDVKLTLSVEGESGLSAADLKKVEALAAKYPDLLLFYDTQYALRYEGVGGTAVTIHTAVQEDWLTAMEYNLKQIKQALGVSV